MKRARFENATAIYFEKLEERRIKAGYPQVNSSILYYMDEASSQKIVSPETAETSVTKN